MAKTYSIGEKMRRAQTLEQRKSAANAWRQSWLTDQNNLVQRLERAAVKGDHAELVSAIGALKEATRKRFIGLNTVISALADPEIETEAD